MKYWEVYLKFSVAAPVQACLIFLKSLRLAFICVCRSFFGVCACVCVHIFLLLSGIGEPPPPIKKKKTN